MKTQFVGFWLFLSVLLSGSVFLVPAALFAQQPYPPQVYIGSVTSPDGNTVIASGTITAWVDGDGDGTFEDIVSGRIDGGSFYLLVMEPAGVSFANKKVKFTVDGIPTAPDQVWVMGGADPINLNLSAVTTPAPTAVPTAVPPTAVPPTAVPPTAVPPTAVPPTVVPPTAVPPTVVPPTVVPPTMEPRAQGCRENPTTRLRPVNDQISADQDGIVEIFIFNPSVNDVSVTVDMMITVPSGIHVYGEGFSCAGGGAGACSGSFTILPGQSKAGHLNVKAEKIGHHQVHFSGYWWPGNNKDLRQPISLTHPFNVSEPSRNISPAPDTVPPPTKTPTAVPPPPPPPPSSGCGLSTGGHVPIGALMLLAGVGMLAVRWPF